MLFCTSIAVHQVLHNTYVHLASLFFGLIHEIKECVTLEAGELYSLFSCKLSGHILLTPDSQKVLGRIARDELSCNFKFHNLRHSHASWLAEHNVPIVVTKARLGHSKEETTLKYYTHLTQGMRENLLNTLNSN